MMEPQMIDYYKMVFVLINHVGFISKYFLFGYFNLTTIYPTYSSTTISIERHYEKSRFSGMY